MGKCVITTSPTHRWAGCDGKGLEKPKERPRDSVQELRVSWDLPTAIQEWLAGRGCRPLSQTGRELLIWCKGTKTICMPKRVCDL